MYMCDVDAMDPVLCRKLVTLPHKLSVRLHAAICWAYVINNQLFSTFGMSAIHKQELMNLL